MPVQWVYLGAERILVASTRLAGVLGFLPLGSREPHAPQKRNPIGFSVPQCSQMDMDLVWPWLDRAHLRRAPVA
jgi:hypothetical protein